MRPRRRAAADDHATGDDARRANRSGLALDVCGNELVVRNPIVIPDVTKLLTAAEQAALSPQGSTVWLTLCYQERGIEPTRPVLPDACGGSGDCLYGMTREQVCVKATTTQPPTPTGGCCSEPPEPACLIIAQLDGVLANQPLSATQIETDVRGMVGTGTTIIGVGWQHGATYLPTPDVATLLGDSVAATGGLRVALSAPVFADSVDRNAVDVVLLRPATGEVLYVDGFTTADATTAGDPAGSWRAVTFRRNTSLSAAPSPKSGDRVVVTVRAALLLDTSCRPVDGANAGRASLRCRDRRRRNRAAPRRRRAAPRDR